MLSMENTGDTIVPSIQKCMEIIIRKYCEMRVKAIHDSVFWDAVVITTADEEQSKAYRFQLEKKQHRRELPQELPFYVFSDPPGTKIGSGGSILYSLDQLHSILGTKLFKMKIFLICAGGRSQRLPTASVLGKLFLPLPFGEPIFHMLDLKLAMYMPFVQRMKPGVFVTCSDDVETYFLPTYEGNRELWSFENDGFTALGITSSIEIGKNHGVYVLPKFTANDGDYLIQSKCIEVLQKPSIAVMRDKGAILEDGNVCTDSIFFFDHEITSKFLTFSTQHKVVSCEIDAYGDFLQPLGSNPSLNYITNVNNVVTATSTLSSTREELFHILTGTSLNVIFLRNSNFYHLGTMAEYIDNIAAGKNSALFKELNCQSIAFSKILRNVPVSESDCGDKQVLDFRHNLGATIMHSVVESSVKIADLTVIEYCLIKSPTQIGGECIISNCKICPLGEDQTIVVPARCCFHSVAIGSGDQIQFVTLAFCIDDDLKLKCSDECWARDLKYMNVCLQNVCSILGLSSDCLFQVGCQSFSLWNAKLFPVARTMEESFRLTNDIVCKLLNISSEFVRHPEFGCRLSMEEILELKNVEKMIEFQEHLRQIIVGTK